MKTNSSFTDNDLTALWYALYSLHENEEAREHFCKKANIDYYNVVGIDGWNEEANMTLEEGERLMRILIQEFPAILNSYLENE